MGKSEAIKVSLRSTWTGPVVALDPKARLGPEVEEDRIAMGHRVINITPRDAKPSGNNVLGWITPGMELLESNIDFAVEWVCGETPEHSGGNEKFFTGAAKDIVRGLISHAISDPTFPDRTLRGTREIICFDEAYFREFITGIRANTPSLRAQQLLSFIAGNDNDTTRSIQYTAQRITAWLSTPEWIDLVCGNGAGNNWDVTDGKTDLFVGLPFQSLASEPAVCRCILGSIFNQLFQANGNIPSPVLFPLDEIAQVRDFGPLKTAWKMGRDYKIALHLMYQDETDITRQWGQNGERALAAGATWISYSGIKDVIEAKRISDMIGTYPVVTLSESVNTGSQGQPLRMRSRSRGNTVTYSEMARPRMRPEELIGLRDDAQVIFARGIHPMICGITGDYKRRYVKERKAA
jgi:type IV secretory pathway TraG/TraD family ATPase VirD4